MSELKTLIVGTGAIGTYIGASLALSGQPVVFLERPDTAGFIRANGLKLVKNGQTAAVESPVVVDNLSDALSEGPFDAAVVAVKSFDTLSLRDDFIPYRVKLPPILCMQNGVENEELLAEGLGGDKVIAGTLTSAVGKPAVGTAVLERLRGIGVADSNNVSQKIVDGFNKAGLEALLYANPGSMKWSKLLTNLLANASSAILDMTPAEIYLHPGLYRLEARQIQEAVEVMRRLGHQVVDLPGTPVRMLALLMQFVPPGIGQRIAYRILGKGRGSKMPSFHIDLYAGHKKSEVGYLNGAVVKFGEMVGVKTPVNQLLTLTLLGLVEGSIARDTYRRQPEKFLAQLAGP